MTPTIQRICTLLDQSRQRIYSSPQESLRLAEEAVALITPDLDPALRVSALVQQIEMLMAFGRIHEGCAVLMAALLIAETENLEAERGQLLYHIGIAHYTLGEFDAAIDYWSDCLNLENRGFSPETRINAYIALGQLYFAFNQPADALRHHQAALNWVTDAINRELYTRLLINIVADLYQLGHYDAAIGYLDEAEALAREIAHLEYIGEALSYRTLILLAQDKLDQIAPLLANGHSMERYWAWGEISWAIVNGKILAAEARPREALAAFQQALALAKKYECTSKIHVIYSILAAAYTQVGDNQQAEIHHRLYQEHFSRLGSPAIFARLKKLEAQLTNTQP